MNIRELSNYEINNKNVKKIINKDFKNNIYERLISKIDITDEFKLSIFNFLEGKTINSFFIEKIQKKFKNKIKIFIKDEYYIRYINNIFYDCICEYIIYENKFNEIENPKNIFLIIIYMSYINQYKLINYLNNFFKCQKELIDIIINKDYEELELFIHYELITYYYTILESFELKYIENYKNNTLSELDKIDFHERIEKYYELIYLLYEDGIIKNKLYKNKDKDNDNKEDITFFDIFVHSSYILENDSSTLIFLKMIINLVEKLDEKDYIDFNNSYPNTDILSELSTNVSNKNRHLIYELNKSLEDDNIYIDSFLYFLNKAYLYRPYQKINKNINFKLNNFEIKDYYNYYFENVYNKKCINFFVFDDELFRPDEFVSIIGDAYRTNNKIILYDIIDSIEESEVLNMTSKIFMICIWLRYINNVLDKHNKQPINYDIEKEEYFVNIKNKDYNKIIIKITRESYIKDIILFLEKSDEEIREFLLKIINNFIYYYVDELREEEKKIIESKSKDNETVNCSICFDDLNNNPDNLILCTYCKNVFHESCINKAWAKRIDYCPLCRKSITKYFLNYSKIRYNLLKDVYEGYHSKTSARKLNNNRFL